MRGIDASGIDGKNNPEESVISEQRTALMREALSCIPPRDREILTRFYIHEQPQEQICSEMNLSETQFRLLKSRAKTRFGELGRRWMMQRALIKFFAKNNHSSGE